MELIKDNLHMNKSKGKMVFSATVDEDFTIPEGKPGMDYKIKDMGEVCIEKVKTYGRQGQYRDVSVFWTAL